MEGTQNTPGSYWQREYYANPCPSEKQVVAMLYVPSQEWGDLYEVEYGLHRGTIFSELDKPFMGGERRHV